MSSKSTSQTEIIDRYVEQLDWAINENSNMTFSLQGLHNFISTEINEEYWLSHIYPEYISSAHTQGDIHIHQLHSLSVYCVGWDLEQLLRDGFCGVRGKVESKPPKHFRSALGQVADFLYTLQGESAGAQAFSNIDTLLAPFIAQDNLSDEYVEQALQEFLFNMNVPTRVGFQTPFTNLSFDITVPPHFKNKHVLIGGKEQEQTYKDFQQEMDRFNNAFAKIMMRGDAKGRIFTFPIPTYTITKDFDWNNPKLEGIWELSAKYGIPYFANGIHADLPNEKTGSIDCRPNRDMKQLHKRGGGFFGAPPMTGSIGAVTINLPRIGFLANDEQDFFNRLKEIMVVAKESLELKRQLSEYFTEHALYPYTKYYLQQVKEHHGEYWINHFNTIGIVGMNEAACNLFGTPISTPQGQEFAKKTLLFINDMLLTFQEETGHLFNLEATPAESTAYRLASKDKKAFPTIIVANESSVADEDFAPFYTNSSHLPVGYTSDIFEAIQLQESLQEKYTGGTILHFFVKEKISNPEVVKKLVHQICTTSKLPYFTFTPTFSICPQHGYLSGMMHRCPTCQGTCEVYSRIVGYIRPLEQWNKGKQAEFAARKPFCIPSSI